MDQKKNKINPQHSLAQELSASPPGERRSQQTVESPLPFAQSRRNHFVQNETLSTGMMEEEPPRPGIRAGACNIQQVCARLQPK